MMQKKVIVLKIQIELMKEIYKKQLQEQQIKDDDKKDKNLVRTFHLSEIELRM